MTIDRIGENLFYDYTFQFWVKSNIIQDCGHPQGRACTCNGRKWRGKTIDEFHRKLGRETP